MGDGWQEPGVQGGGDCSQELGEGPESAEVTGIQAAGPWALCSPSCSKHQDKWGAAAWGLLDRPSPDPAGCCGYSSVLREPDPRLQLRLDRSLPLTVSIFILCAWTPGADYLAHTATLGSRALPSSGDQEPARCTEQGGGWAGAGPRKAWKPPALWVGHAFWGLSPAFSPS